MSSTPWLSIVLPAYNEARAIRRTLEAMRTFLDAQGYTYQVIVAADGDDDTPAIVEDIAQSWPQLELTARAGRHGKGQGLRRGMALAKGDRVGFIDADYKATVDETLKLFPWFDQGYDVVIGSRGWTDSRIEQAQPWFRIIGSRAFGVCMHLLLGLWSIRDTQCGFKFFRREVAEDIFRRTRIDGYMCDVEILWLAERLGYRVKETGIVWRDDGDTRLDLVAGNIQNGLDLLRIRFGRYPRTVPNHA